MLPRGIVSSTVTPFSSSGDLRLDLLPAHIDWLLAEGTNGISPLGSTGEFAALDIDQRKRVVEAAIAAAAGRTHVMAGTHHYATHLTIELSRHAQEAGADSLLIVPPYYGSPSLSQAMDHYRAVASAVDIPIIVYHNAVNTNVDLKTEHLVRLFEEGAIAGVKMSNPAPDRIVQLLQATDSKLWVYAGVDTVAFEGLCHGAHGWISGIPGMVPRVARRLYETIAEQSDLPSARAQWRLLAPIMRLQFGGLFGGGQDPHWLSVMKGTLNLVGPSIGDPLPPIRPLDEPTRQQLAGMLRALGYDVAT